MSAPVTIDMLDRVKDDEILSTEFPASYSGEWGLEDRRVTFKDLEEVIFKRMYEIEVIVFCKFCGTGNAKTNGNCIQCGAPAGWSR